MRHTGLRADSIWEGESENSFYPRKEVYCGFSESGLGILFSFFPAKKHCPLPGSQATGLGIRRIKRGPFQICGRLLLRKREGSVPDARFLWERKEKPGQKQGGLGAFQIFTLKTGRGLLINFGKFLET